MAKVKLKFWFRKLRFNRHRTATSSYSAKSSLSPNVRIVPRHSRGVSLIKLEKLDPSCGEGSSSVLVDYELRNPNLLQVHSGEASEEKCRRKTANLKSSEVVDCGCRPKKSKGSRSIQFCTSGKRSWCKTSSKSAQATTWPVDRTGPAKETRLKPGMEMEILQSHRKSVHMDRRSPAKPGIENVQQSCKEFVLNSEFHHGNSEAQTPFNVGASATSCRSRNRHRKQKNFHPIDPPGITTNSAHENCKSRTMHDISVCSPLEEIGTEDGETNKATLELALSNSVENADVAFMAKCRSKIKSLQCASARELEEDNACISKFKSKSPQYASARYSASAATASDMHSWERDFPSFTSEDTFFSSFERSRRSFSSTSSSIELYDRKLQSYGNVSSSDASMCKPKRTPNGDVEEKKCRPNGDLEDNPCSDAYSKDVSVCERDAVYSNGSNLVPWSSKRSEHKWLYGIQEDSIDDTSFDRLGSNWISNPDVEYYDDEYARRHERARRKLSRRRHCTNPVLLRRRAQWEAKWKLIQNQVKQSADVNKNADEYADDDVVSPKDYKDFDSANEKNYTDFIHQKVQSARSTSRRRALSLDQISAGIITSTIKSLNDNDNVKSVATSQSARFESESVAVVKCSSDPVTDFQRSMVEMILERDICTSQDLEELLQCFLSLNSDEHHETIITAFTQIWDKVFNDQQNQSIKQIGT